MCGHAARLTTTPQPRRKKARRSISSPDSINRASSKGLDAKALLAKHDSYGFFSALGDLLVTGPTRTNVNDYRAIVVA